jgi:hypothetical protein
MPTEVEGEHGVATALERDGQLLPAFLLAGAAEVVEQQHARCLVSLRARVKRSAQLDLVHRVEVHAFVCGGCLRPGGSKQREQADQEREQQEGSASVTHG